MSRVLTRTQLTERQRRLYDAVSARATSVQELNALLLTHSLKVGASIADVEAARQALVAVLDVGVS